MEFDSNEHEQENEDEDNEVEHWENQRNDNYHGNNYMNQGMNQGMDQEMNQGLNHENTQRTFSAPIKIAVSPLFHQKKKRKADGIEYVYVNGNVKCKM